MYRKKVDLNHSEIVHGLRKIGASVFSTHRVGSDFPDLVVGFRGQNYLIEVKSGKKKPTKSQELFHASWQGKIYVVHTLDEAISILTHEE